MHLAGSDLRALQCRTLSKVVSPCLRRLTVSIEELDWDLASSEHRLQELGDLQTDYVIAADCLYTDQARNMSPSSQCLEKLICPRVSRLLMSALLFKSLTTRADVCRHEIVRLVKIDEVPSKN